MSLICLTSLENPVTNEAFLEKLFPNPYDFLATLLAFIVLLIIVFYLAYKPVKKLLKARAEYVENNIRQSEKDNQLAKENLFKAKEEVSGAKAEALKIISNANKKEQEIILEAKNKAKEEAKKEYENKQQELAEDLKQKEDEIHSLIVKNAYLMSEEILKREISPQDDDRLVDEFLKKVKND